MRFLADESCDFSIVRVLRQAGHDVAAIAELSTGVADTGVIDRAIQESRIILTEDKDFGQLVYASSLKTVGVIFIRFPGSARSSLAATVVQLLREKGTHLPGRFVVVQPGRIRIT